MIKPEPGAPLLCIDEPFRLPDGAIVVGSGFILVGGGGGGPRDESRGPFDESSDGDICPDMYGPELPEKRPPSVSPVRSNPGEMTR